MSSAVVEQDARPIVSQPVPQNRHRLLILRNGASELLVAGDRSPFALPDVEVPRWERVAENLTAAVRKCYGISAICLFAPEPSTTATEGEPPFHQVMETRQASIGAPDGTNWLPIGAISDQSFTHQDQAAIAAMLRQIDEFQRGETFGPFGKPGWIDELFAWTQCEIEPYGLRLSDECRQLNASPTFALLRIETDHEAVWFKAVGEPNLREFPITLRLAQLFPTYVPRILATRPHCNGWLSLEAAGTQLSGTAEIAPWETTVATLADLQIKSIQDCGSMLEAGAHDLGSVRLSSLIGPFLDMAGHLMERQSKIPPATLSQRELAAVGESLEEGLSLLENFRVPDSIGHLDPNGGNVIISRHGCVFLDWAEGYVGHPFFTFAYLLEHFRQTAGTDEQSETQLIEAYVRPWEGVVSCAAITESLKVSPLLAVFAYAAGSGLCSDYAKLPALKTEGYLRSLTRRMSREAKQFMSRRHRCTI